MKTVNELQTLRAQALELAVELGQNGAEAYQIAYRLGQEIHQRQVLQRTLRHLVSDVETLFHAPAILRDFTTDELNDFNVEFYEQLWQVEAYSGCAEEMYESRIEIAASWRMEMRQYINGQ